MLPLKKHNNLWLIYSFALAVVAFLYHGYQFNTGDQSEHLPQVYRLLNPELYKGDFFLTLYDQTFTVREYWVWLVYGLSLVFGVKATCLLLYFLCLLTIAASWIKIAQHFTGSFFAGVLSAFFQLTILNSFTVGGNNLAGNLFVGSTFAEALASIGIYFFISEKRFAGMLLLGVATWFQALVGLQWCILLCALHWISTISFQTFKQSIFYGLIYILAASPMLFPVMKAQFTSDFVYDKTMYYQLLYVNRNFLHYVPSLFPKIDYAKMILLLAASFLLIKSGYSYVSKSWMRLAIIIVAGCVAYAFMLETLHIMSIGKLQWFKTTVWLNALCCMAMASAIVQSKYVNESFISSKLMQISSYIFIGFTIIFISTSAYIPRFEQRWQVGNNPKTDLQLMHEWISQNLPIDAIILAPPDDESFSCEAKRPMPANYKAVVHEPFYFFEWKRTMESYYHVDFSTLGLKSAKNAAIDNYCNFNYPANNKAQFRLDDTTKCDVSMFNSIHTQGKWKLTEIK